MARRQTTFVHRGEIAAFASDHGTLAGLGDDDHTQYHTDARALSWLQAQNVSELTNDSGYLTSVAVSDLDNGTDGELITWSSTGVATTVAVGTSGHVLTSNGAGAAPTFQAGPVALVQTVDSGVSASLRYDSTQVFESVTNGVAAIDSTNGRPSYYMRDSAGGSERASFQAWSDNHFYMTNSTATGDIVVRTRNYAGSSNITSLRITAETVATDDTTVELYHGTAASFPTPVLSTRNYGARIQRGNGTGTPVLELYGPTSGNSSINFTQTTNSRAQIQYDHATELYFRTTRTGEGFRFYNDVDGDLITANSGGSVDLYHNGVKTLSTSNERVKVLSSTTNSATGFAYYEFRGSDDARWGWFGYGAGSGELRLENESHGGTIRIGAENNSGTFANMLFADPDSEVRLYYAGVEAMRTIDNGVQLHQTVFVEGGTLTIASGAITATHSYHIIDTEAAAASDDLDTINGGVTGAILIIQTLTNVRDVTLKHATGNLILDGAADITMNGTRDKATFIYDGTNWCMISYSNNV